MKNNFMKTICLIFCLLMMVACAEKPVITPEPSDVIETEKTESTPIVNQTTKPFQGNGFTIEIPSQWDTLQQQGEDGTAYFFREPDLKEKCQLIVSITGAEYKNDRTKNEYLEYLSSSYENVEISFYENQAISGYEGKKVIATYVEDNQKFIRIAYDNIVAGVRMYNFTITYPEAQKETYDDIFNSILQSIVIE